VLDSSFRNARRISHGDRTVLDTAPFEMSVGFHMGDGIVLDTAPLEMRVGFHMGIELC
jgi:hypothetical protein